MRDNGKSATDFSKIEGAAKEPKTEGLEPRSGSDVLTNQATRRVTALLVF